MIRIPLCLVLSISAIAHAQESSLTSRVESFGKSRFAIADAAPIDPAAQKAILTRPDPETSFLRYAFGLQRHAKKLLSEEQTAKLKLVMDRHTPDHSRWHDERNTLRCKFNQLMWQYVAPPESPENQAPALFAQLESWMRLRMAWTRQEHLAQYRFGRDVWNVLTPDQQAKLQAGQWKSYVTLETGHTRADATGKIITKALGKPDRKAAFEAAVAEWSARRRPLHEALAEAENNERRLVFAMDANSESMSDRAAQIADEAYSKLYLAEIQAMRTIIAAGYINPAARCRKAAADAWGEAVERYKPGAAALIELLQRP